MDFKFFRQQKIHVFVKLTSKYEINMHWFWNTNRFFDLSCLKIQSKPCRGKKQRITSLHIQQMPSVNWYIPPWLHLQNLHFLLKWYGSCFNSRKLLSVNLSLDFRWLKLPVNLGVYLTSIPVWFIPIIQFGRSPVSAVELEATDTKWGHQGLVVAPSLRWFVASTLQSTNIIFHKLTLIRW